MCDALALSRIQCDSVCQGGGTGTCQVWSVLATGRGQDRAARLFQDSQRAHPSLSGLQTLSTWALQYAGEAHQWFLGGFQIALRLQWKTPGVFIFVCSVWWKAGGLPLPLSQLAGLWGPQKCVGHVGLPWARSSEEGDCRPKPRLELDRTARGAPCGCAL